jgi:hypothetical protein
MRATLNAIVRVQRQHTYVATHIIAIDLVVVIKYEERFWEDCRSDVHLLATLRG